MFKKIRNKLIVAVGITTIIIIGVYSYLNISSQSKTLVSEIEGHAHQLSDAIKNSTRQYMLLNQREQLHETITAIGQHLGICGIRILNKEGIIIYSAKKEEIGVQIDKKAESCYACHTEDVPLERLPDSTHPAPVLDRRQETMG